MKKLLLKAAATRLLDNIENGRLTTSELLQTIAIIRDCPDCCDASDSCTKPKSCPNNDGKDCEKQCEAGECKEEKTCDKSKCSKTCDKESSCDKAETLSPAALEKKEISDKIIELGGTPPTKGSLSKFKKALLDLEVEEVEPDEAEDEEESDEDIDKFNELMQELQDLYDRLEEEEKIEDMRVLIKLTKEVNKSVNSPDELSLSELKKLIKNLKKYDK